MSSMTTLYAIALLGACGRVGFDIEPSLARDGAPLADGTPGMVVPVAHIQEAAAPCCGGGITESQTLANVSAEDTLIVAIGWFSTSPAITADIATLTDTLGNTYTLIPSSYALEPNVVGYGNGNFYSEIGYATHSTAGADTVTFTLTASVTFSLIYVVEASPCVLDMASGSEGDSTTPDAGTVITTSDGELAVAITDMDQSMATSNLLSAGPGWAMDSSGVAGTAIFGQESILQSAAGQLTGNFNANGAAGQWMASTAAFKSIVSAP